VEPRRLYNGSGPAATDVGGMFIAAVTVGQGENSMTGLRSERLEILWELPDT
jgi:hypothetical protein